MTNPYVTISEKYNRPESVLDLHRFARDLAKLLKGKFVEQKTDDINERYVSIEIDGAVLSLTKGWKKSELEKITVNIRPRDLRLDHNDTPRGQEYKTPEATVSTDRPLDKIVADITRRVIEPGKAPIAKLHEHAATCAQQRDDLETTAARLRKDYPLLQVNIKTGERFSAQLYRNSNDEPYLSGNVRSDGSVSIDRIGSLTAKQFERVMAALYPRKK